MSTVRLAGVLEQVKTLTAAEQRQLRDQLDALIGARPAPLTEEEFARQMVAEGFMAAPAPDGTATFADSEWEPVPVIGEPVSQTIINERR